jgi:hypothetical protein
MISSPYAVLSQSKKPESVKSVSGGGRASDFWTRTLGAMGLESPGYHETVGRMKAAGLIKNKKAHLDSES